MSRLLCFGDLHLGQGNRLQDQADVLDRIAGIAIGERVDGVLSAGDLLEGPSVPPEQLELIARLVEQLRTAQIPMLSIVGNGKHDAAMRDTNGLRIFDHIAGITVASHPDVYLFAGCMVATLPWVSPARLVAGSGHDTSRDEINVTVAQLLVDVARGLKEDCERVRPDLPHVLLAHWSVSGTALPSGIPVAELREPVIVADELDAVGFDHVVLGHIHRPQTVGARGFYVGSPMPLNFGETHVGHGVAILDTDEAQEIDFYAARHVEVASRPLVTLDFNHGDPVAQIALSSSLGWDIPGGAIIRLRYTGTAEQARRLDIGLLRRELADAGAHSVKIEPQIIRAGRARVEGVDENLGVLAALELYIDANTVDRSLADRMRERTAAYTEQVAA